ncbi:SCO family protein [Natronococcus wangiae]|uniref:SCO family protein n=1 Tax=Natronococcus wangiae TaxID=3068275 RepID=UPI00273F2E5B|nr:SCO family protein [Natronococcus sp. AD5]
MERRTYLQALGAAGLGGIAGCLEDTLDIGGDSQTVLDDPETPGDPTHPVHGEEFPSFSLPDPISDETVSLEDFVGERAFLMTFFYTSCPDGACPSLLLRLRRVQEDAIERGYADDIGLLALTFDPDRDTPEILEEYGKEQGVDLEAGNWNFLRPENNEAAEKVVEEDIGMPIKRVEDHDALGHGDGDGNQTDEGTGQDDGDGTNGTREDGNETDHDHDENQTDEGHDEGSHDGGDEGYAFVHYNLIVLVNDRGIVERAYPRAIDPQNGVSVETIVEHSRTVVQG